MVRNSFWKNEIISQFEQELPGLKSNKYFYIFTNIDQLNINLEKFGYHRLIVDHIDKFVFYRIIDIKSIPRINAGPSRHRY